MPVLSMPTRSIVFRINKSYLMSCFAHRHQISLPNSKRPGEWMNGVINAIEFEDGGGLNFNVQIGGQWTFVRTVGDM